MKLKLAVAFAVLLFAMAARADEFQTAVGPVYIPNGSTVTLDQAIPDPWGESAGPGLPSGIPAVLLQFTFADGYGQIITAGIYDELGSIAFTTPVSALTLNWDAQDFFWVADNLNDGYGFPDDTFGPVNWSGPGITTVNWGSQNDGSGIDSMTYTLDSADPPSVPEPSSLLLSGISLALLCLFAKLKIHATNN
jgi:hypothetical protein